MDWLDILRARKAESKKTYGDISKETGIPKTTIEKLFSGRTNDPKIGMLTKIAHCIGCTIDELAGTERRSDGHELADDEKRLIEQYRTLDNAGKSAVCEFTAHEAQRAAELRRAAGRRIRRMYPKLYYDFPVSAGTGEFMDDSNAAVINLENEPPSGTDYILRVSGNSMEPELSNGDLICVSRTDELEYGEIGIFVYSGSVYVKQYTPEGLRSLNPEYALIPGSVDIRCLGRVLGKVEGTAERAD